MSTTPSSGSAIQKCRMTDNPPVTIGQDIKTPNGTSRVKSICWDYVAKLWRIKTENGHTRQIQWQ